MFLHNEKCDLLYCPGSGEDLLSVVEVPMECLASNTFRVRKTNFVKIARRAIVIHHTAH